MITGLGELGLHPKELRRYSLQEFMWKLDGARKISNMLHRDRWEQTREVCFTMAQMSGKTAKSNLTKYHVMQFPWDSVKQKKSLSMMTREERTEYMKGLIDQHNSVWSNHQNKN